MSSNPLSYYRNLRLEDLENEILDGSRVVRITTPEGDSLRLVDLMQFTFLTSARSPKPSSSRVTTDAGVYLAARHFNDRNDTLVPGLAERLKNCNIYLTLEMYDSTISSLKASRNLFLAHARQHSLKTPVPAGIVGSYSSRITTPLAILSGAYYTPQVGGISSAAYLDEKAIYPTYARTNPSNKSYAKGVVALLKHWGVSRFFCVYTRSENPTSLFERIAKEASEAGIEIMSTNYEARDGESVELALEKIQQSGFRYVVSVGSGSTANNIMEGAYERKIAGVRGYQWIHPNFGGYSRSTFTLDQEEATFAKALSGVASIDVVDPHDQRFLDAIEMLRIDDEFRQDYIESHGDPSVFDSFNWTTFSPTFSAISYSSYDALMSLAISACENENDFFTEQEHWKTLLNTKFRGVTGSVAFEPDTAARAYDSLILEVNNVIPDLISIDTNSSDEIQFVSRTAMTIDFSKKKPVTELEAYVFAESSADIPTELPPLGEVEHNTISEGVRIFGWIACAVLMVVSVLFAGYTYLNRRKSLIRMSQPLFLGMMCCGTLVLASAIIPLSLQDHLPAANANIACMATPWLIAVGFSTAFSAIFTKTWRVNRLFGKANNMTRFEVRAKDVIWPFALHSTANMILLALITAFAPLVYSRIEVSSNVDQFGRSLESYGACVPSNDASGALLIVLVVFNFLVIVFANYQCYLGRHIPNALNEKDYIAFQMTSFLETFLIGAPILYFVHDSPTANFALKVVLIFFTCLAILLPMFLPKMLAKDTAGMSVDALHQAIQVHSKSLTPVSRKNSRDSVGSSGAWSIPRGSEESSIGANSGHLASSVQDLQQRATKKASFARSTHNTSGSFRRPSEASSGSGGSNSLPSSVQELRASKHRNRSLQIRSGSFRRGSEASSINSGSNHLASSVRELRHRASMDPISRGAERSQHANTAQLPEQDPNL